MIRLLCYIFLSLALLSQGGCNSESPAPEQGPIAATPDGDKKGEWLLHGLSPGEQRFSPLDQIDKDNVTEVGLAFSYDNFVVRGRTNRGAQSTPLMEDGVLYFTGAWSVVYAVDARTGKELWQHDPEVEGKRARVACCDAVNRGVALSGDKILVATLDGYLLALDKKSGKQVWRVDTLTERDSSYTITAAPRLVGDKVVIGNGGGEMGVRGYVTAYSIENGQQEWRFFVVPSAGPDENPDVTKARASWADDMNWEFGGGGTAWDSMVYDAELDLLYVGTGNGSPWSVWNRGSEKEDGEYHDNLYLSSIVALDAQTGQVRWHYQTTPGDSWDYTATQHMILADMEWNDKPRKVIMQAPKNGFFYTLDRETGELLKADPYVTVSWADGVDMKTGRPNKVANSDYSKKPRAITPSPLGGHNWPPMAYHPGQGLVFIPTLDATLGFINDDGNRNYVKRARNTRARFTFVDPENDAELFEDAPFTNIESKLIAWDPIKGEARWTADTKPYWLGGVLATAGDLVISGAPDGYLYFYDAETGEIIHSINTGTIISAPPMTYELDGEQYIAVLAGYGGAPLATSVPGYASLKYQNSSRLLVFKLGGKDVPLPPAVEKPVQHPIPTGLPTDQTTIARGQQKYMRFCVSCHQPNGLPSGYPDLWNMSPATEENFDAIVLDGAFEYAGMAGFRDVLTTADTLAIRAYIADSRRSGTAQEAVIGAH